MAKTLQQLLGAVYLTELVEKIKTGLPNFVPDEFYSNKEQIFGDAARHYRVSGTRQTARQSIYGAPPRRINMVGISAQDIKLLHFVEELQLRVQDFQALHNYTDFNLQQL